jgi:GPI mannosyltransferase 2
VSFDPLLEQLPILTCSCQLSLLGTLKALFLTSLVFAPSILYQYKAYRAFCVPLGTDVGAIPEWCSNLPPSVYTHVQSAYWHVGFLRYWTPAQIPNILLGAPVLALLFVFGIHHLRTALPRIASDLGLLLPANKINNAIDKRSVFVDGNLTPHVIHSLVMACTLLFAAHTQIILRLAASMPVVYWAAAWLWIEYPMWGRRWIAWSVVWGAISIVLWVVFLPPA